MFFTIGAWVAGVVGVLGLITFLVPFLFYQCLRPQDLKKKYDAKWAIVTGGSSGIGRAISEKCCKQGISVIIVAVPDELLPNSVKELRRDYPNVEVVPVGVDLSKPGYMEAVAVETKDRDIQLLFCNAGFMKTGFFADVPIGAWRANSAVNVGCHIDLSHEYINRMIKKQKRGCVVFTSSPASMLPSPFSTMYGATKVAFCNVSLISNNFVSGFCDRICCWSCG
jgi:short-subunit dehydrogenase